MPRRRTPPVETAGLVVAELPVMPIRDFVLFPRVVTGASVGREPSLQALEAALARDRTVIAVAQRDPTQETITTAADLYPVGTEAVIGQTVRLPDGSTNIVLQGLRRVRLLELTQTTPYLVARVAPLDEPVRQGLEIEAQMRTVLSLFEKCLKFLENAPEDAYVTALNADDPGWLADFVTWTMEWPLARRQEILEILDPRARLRQVSVYLARELDLLELKHQIQTQVQQEVDRSQREYFLREQLKAIQRELGESDPFTREIHDLRERVARAQLPEPVARKAHEEIDRLSLMPPAAPDVAIIRTYLDWLLHLPWHTATPDNLDITQAAAILDANHYGLPKVKERILEYLAVRHLAGARMRSPILCFVGPPGVGKTSLGRSIAQAMGRRFVRVSLGGIRDEAEIRGHRRTYVGALPGRIIQAMRTAQTINPVFMLDEIDKIGMDFRGDPSAALLEVLDPEQNHAFSDHYLDVPYDLSQVLFITTANMLDPVPPALRDRLEVIVLSGYAEDEKLAIARRFLIPRQLAEHGLESSPLVFTTGALRQIIRDYTYEAGVRNLEREIATICRKVARQVAAGQRPPRSITARSLARYLGRPRHFWGRAEEEDAVGVATAVYWNPAGGDVAPVEVTLMPGSGQLILTGQLGEVMKESATAALSYLRSRAQTLGLPERFHEKIDIHIHVPAGGVPKDGPSAGITMATALISALTRRPVRRDVAMTGEITLRGRVLPVGGLKEKILAAHRAGITTFIMPRRNAADLEDIPATVRRALRFVLVTSMDEVLPVALRPAAEGPVALLEVESEAKCSARTAGGG